MDYMEEILGEDDELILRVLDNSYFEPCMEVLYENSYMPAMFEKEEFKKKLWKEYISNTCLYFAIIRKKDDKFIGYCGINDIRKKKWEIGIEILRIYTNKGYGYRAIKIMLNKLKEKTGRKEYISQVNSDNYKCHSLMDKLEAIPNRIVLKPVIDKKIEHLVEEELSYKIDSKLEKVAEKFGTDSRKLLTHILEYVIKV